MGTAFCGGESSWASLVDGVKLKSKPVSGLDQTVLGIANDETLQESGGEYKIKK